MKELTRLCIERAENEAMTGKVLLKVSGDKELQRNVFRIEKEFTFYSAVISHCYYCLFFSAKAILAREGIITKSPYVHAKTLKAFEENIVRTGKLDVELLRIYKSMIVRADELSGIFSREKGKRGHFTYQKLPQANLEPAMESMRNALFFFKHINALVRKE